MGNIVNYAQTNLRTFREMPFNDVDSLVLSQLSYLYLEEFHIDFNNVCLKDLLKAELFPSMFRDSRYADENYSLLVAVAANPRFRNIGVKFYVNDVNEATQKQFSAVTFLLDNGKSYVAFRGTDATFIGWKEDFNMAFVSPVPSQEAALSYLNFVAETLRGNLIVGGHSKGGNLATYAAMMCSEGIKSRIEVVYSHDGPGFRDNVFDSIEYQMISGKVRKTVPQSSLIGMLLENHNDYTVVASSQKGVMQHDPYSWQVEDDSFVIVEEISKGAANMNKTLNEWINGLDNPTRELFADSLYNLMVASGVRDLVELSKVWQQKVPVMAASLKNLDPEIQRYLLNTVKDLIVISLKNAADIIK